MQRLASVFGNVVRIEAGLCRRTIVGFVELVPWPDRRNPLAVIQRSHHCGGRPRQTRASRRASPAAQALRSDVVRRAASRGGTLRCAEARRVAYRDVDKSYASDRPPQHGAVASRLQDSAAVIKRAPSVHDVRSLSDVRAVAQSGRTVPAPCLVDRSRGMGPGARRVDEND
jgi:hypothetical protein